MSSYVCNTCEKTLGITHAITTCTCGGLFDLAPHRVFKRSKIDTSEWSMFRYHAMMPLKNESWRDITLGEGMTPLVRLHDHLWVKLEYAMPTLSFKDRGAAMLIWLCKTIGVTKVIQDSSGNAGNAIAAYAAKAGIACEIFVPKETSEKKIKMIKSHGATVTIVDGDRQACAKACRDKAEKDQIFYASHVYNPFFYEGTMTYVYELYEQLGRLPAHLVVPVGNGTLFLGLVYALETLMANRLIDHMPHVIVVQTEKCAPIAKAYMQGMNSHAKVTQEKTLAEGIAIGEPMRSKTILEKMKQYQMTVCLAAESDIQSAREHLAHLGYYVEYTTAATYAAYLSLVKTKKLEGDVVMPLCGAGLKSE